MTAEAGKITSRSTLQDTVWQAQISQGEDGRSTKSCTFADEFEAMTSDHVPALDSLSLEADSRPYDALSYLHDIGKLL